MDGDITVWMVYEGFVLCIAHLNYSKLILTKGTCNNNQADDCMIPGGILVDDCADMADYWPASGVNGEICTPPTALPTVGGNKPTSKPCPVHPDCNLLDSE